MAIFTRPINNPFNKPAKSNLELVQEWKNRGLIISDDNRVIHYLDFIGYYRFSAYTIPFQNTSSISSHQFKPNTTFDDILDCYTFDRELRLLIMDAIERVEVAVRTQISNVMSLGKDQNGQTQGAFWYLNTEYFLNHFSHYDFLARVEKQLWNEQKKLNQDIEEISRNTHFSDNKKQESIEKAKKENFLRHYLSQYSEPKLPPCWMMVEMLTLGELSHLYSGIKSNALKKEIARNLGGNAEILTSWLHGFNAIRNFCAHHSRVWNRELGISIKMPRSSQIKWLSKPPENIAYERRIYSILIALQTILYTVSPSSLWAKRLKELLEKYPNIPKKPMGIPENWYCDEFWQAALT